MMHNHRWLALPAVAAVLLASGIFFALQSRGAADQYASVASFFLSLLGAAASVVAWVRQRPHEPRVQPPPPEDGPRVTVIGKNPIVMTGPRAKATVKKTRYYGKK